MERFSFAEPRPLDAILTDVAVMTHRWTLHSTHPRYFGLFNPHVYEVGIWGDALAALYNPHVGGWWHAPAACEIERHMLHFFACAMGWDVDEMAAHFTTGWSEANQTAVLAAIALHHGDSLREGLTKSGARPAVYVSRREPPLLSMVVGITGNTAGGAIDALPELAALARREGLWFHVNAAWGGSALVSPSLGVHLRGVELADSVTWDAHKWLSVPLEAGMFFCKHREPLTHMFDIETGYVPEGVEGEDDLYRVSIQWSRRHIGLKVFCTIAALGADGLRRMIEHQATMGDVLRAKLVERGWIIVNSSVLPVVCFHAPACRRRTVLGRRPGSPRVQWWAGLDLGGSAHRQGAGAPCVHHELPVKRSRPRCADRGVAAHAGWRVTCRVRQRPTVDGLCLEREANAHGAARGCELARSRAHAPRG